MHCWKIVHTTEKSCVAAIAICLSEELIYGYHSVFHSTMKETWFNLQEFLIKLNKNLSLSKNDQINRALRLLDKNYYPSP